MFDEKDIPLYLFDSASIAIAIIREGKFFFVNKETELVTGYSKTDLLSKEFTDFIHPDDRALVHDRHTKRIKGESVPASYEFRIINKAGNCRWIELKTSLVYSDKGPGTLCFLSDVSDRRFAEEALKNSEAILKSMFEASDAGMLVLKNRKIIKSNSAFCKMTGYLEEQLQNQSTAMLYPDSKIFDEVGRDLYALEGNLKIETVLRKKDGTLFNVRLSSSKLDPNDLSAGICLTVMDISEDKRMQAMLATSERRFRDLCDFLPQIVYEADEKGIITYINNQGYRFFGFSQEDVAAGISVLSLIREEDLVRVRDAALEAKLNKTGLSIEFNAARKDGSTFPVLAFMEPIVQENGAMGYRNLLVDVTPQKRLELQRNEAMQMLHDIIEFLPDPTFVIDNSRKVVAWNRAIEALTGIKKEDILGCGDYAYAMPFYKKARPILIDLVFESNSGTETEYDFVHRIGNNLYAEVFIPHFNIGRSAYLWGCACPLYDRNGVKTGAIESIRDITDIRNSEMLLRQSEERFRTFMEQASEGFMLVDENGYVCEWNAALAQVTGYSYEEVIGKSWADINIAFLPPDRKTKEREERIRFAVTETLKVGATSHFLNSHSDSTIITKNGKIISIQQSTFLVKTSKGFRIGSAIRDITEAKKAEVALKASEERFRQFSNNVSDGFWIMDFATKICVFANSAIEAMLGAAIMGKELKGFLSIIHPKDREKFYQEKLPGVRNELDFRIVLPDKSERWIRSRQFPLKDENGNTIRVFGIATDITEYKKASFEREMHRLQMIQTDKMATLGILVSGVAHEINNPNNYLMLNAKIIGRVWQDILPIIEKHAADNPQFKLADLDYREAVKLLPDIIQGLFDGTMKIKQIVDSLRDYARKEPSELTQKIDLNKIVESSLVLLSNGIQKTTDHFTTHLAQDLPCVTGSAQQLEQVVINLISNACQALTQRTQKVDVHTYAQDDEILLKIVDEGIGISSGNMDKIFDPFFTTKRESGGTGLGLPISNNIIRNHKGSIEFTSLEGKGTTVIVRLPDPNKLTLTQGKMQ